MEGQKSIRKCKRLLNHKDSTVFKHFSLQYSGLLLFTLEHLSWKIFDFLHASGKV